MKVREPLPAYDANEHLMLMHELEGHQAKMENLRYIRARFTEAYRKAYMRNRMHKARGVLTPERVQQMDDARATYDRLTAKWRMAHAAMAAKEKELKRRIARYQKASLRKFWRNP